MTWKLWSADFWTNRIHEITPGALVWLTLFLAIILSFRQPLWVISFIIVFDLYWVIRIFYLSGYIIQSWLRFRRERQIAWWDILQAKHQNWSDYYHLVFLPTVNEPFEVLDQTLKAIASSHYDLKKIIVVIAGEARKHEHFTLVSQQLLAKYPNTFYKILVTEHPSDLPAEIPGKGSNLNYSGHKTKEYIDQIGLSYDKIIVSTFDCDTQVSNNYFAYLTNTFLNEPDRYHASYQPVAVYHNNFWESNALTRVVANSTTFWLLTDLARSDRLFTFSSHSMSWQALVDIGFWQKDIVTEDSRIFLQCFYRYSGNYKVVPLYVELSMNTVYMGHWWQSLINQYKQMRRWAWGVEHYPYMIKQNRLHPEIPWLKKLKYLWNQTEGVYSWATAPLLITILGRLPLWVANKNVQATALAQNAPQILETIMNVGLVGLIVIAVLNTLIIPKLPINRSHWYYLSVVLQWLLFPITMMVFGAIPATEAQTRLLLGGKYRLGFWVTVKK